MLCYLVGISFAVNQISQFNNLLQTYSLDSSKTILRYLKGTINFGINYGNENSSLRGYVDADWGSNLIDYGSYTGYVFILNGMLRNNELLHYRPQKQSIWQCLKL